MPRSKSGSGPRLITWFYGVLRRRTAPRVKLEGPPDVGPVRLLKAGDALWLAVADAPREQYGEQAIASKLSDLEWVGERALGHDRVVQALAAQGTLVPARLFTLFESDARALDELQQSTDALNATLDRLEGRHEWSLRMRRTAKPETRPVEGLAPKPASGRDFLARKQAARQKTAIAVEQLNEAVAAAQEDLVRLAVEHVRKPLVASGEAKRLLLDCAMLVPKEANDALHELASTHEKRLAAVGVSLELTGPWAPYHFSSTSR